MSPGLFWDQLMALRQSSFQRPAESTIWQTLVKNPSFLIYRPKTYQTLLLLLPVGSVLTTAGGLHCALERWPGQSPEEGRLGVGYGPAT